jgi:transcriptional regulator
VYTPQQFDETRVAVLHALMRAKPLATLVTLHETTIVANPIPVQTLSLPEPLGSLCGHIARANPLWRQHPPEREALAIFQGPQVYISPSLYPSKKISGEVVPTWDYVVVQAYGTLRFIHDAEWLLGLVSSLTDRHEALRTVPWKVADAPASYVRTMLRAIVGFEFVISKLTGKWKVSQNRGAADQHGVVGGLRAAGDPDSREVAELLAERSDRPEAGAAGPEA